MKDYIKFRIADMRLQLFKNRDYSEFVNSQDEKSKVEVLKKAAKAANLEQKIFAHKAQ